MMVIAAPELKPLRQANWQPSVPEAAHRKRGLKQTLICRLYISQPNTIKNQMVHAPKSTLLAVEGS